MDNFTKNLLIKELDDSIKKFYSAKRKNNINKIKYAKGYSEGVMQILLIQKAITEEEIKDIILKYETSDLKIKSGFLDIDLNDLDTPAIYRKMRN